MGIVSFIGMALLGEVFPVKSDQALTWPPNTFQFDDLSPPKIVVANLEGDFNMEKHLLERAGCKQVGRDTWLQVQSVQSIGALYMLKEATLHMNLVLQTRMAKHDQSQHLDELKSAKILIDQVEDAISSRVEALKTVAQHAETLDHALEGVKAILNQCAKGDAIPDETKRQKVHSACKLKLAPKISSLQQKAAPIDTPVIFEEIPADEMKKSFERMGKLLALDAQIDQKCEDQWRRALEYRAQVTQSLSTALSEQSHAQVMLDITRDKIQREKKEFPRSSAMLERLVQDANKKVGGQGVWRKSGSPCNDKTNHITSLWNQNRFDLLRKEYGEKPNIRECENFHFWMDPNPSQDQKDALARYNEFEEKARVQKEGHHEKISSLWREESNWTLALNETTRSAEEAQQAYDKMIADQKRDGECMAEWAKRNPVQYSELLAMENMRIMLKASSAYQVNVTTGQHEVLSSASMLETWIEVDEFGLAKEVIEELHTILTSPDDSGIGFLRQLPSMDLNQALTPQVAWSTIAKPHEVLAPYLNKSQHPKMLDRAPSHTEL